MRERPFIRPRPERPLRAGTLRRGRSLIRTLAGISLVAGVGVIAFAAGYPTGNIASAPARNAGQEAQTNVAAGTGEDIRAASDRTRPDFLAKLASAPAVPPQQDPSPSGFESGALAAHIEAAAEVTSSIAPARKAPRPAVAPPTSPRLSGPPGPTTRAAALPAKQAALTPPDRKTPAAKTAPPGKTAPAAKAAPAGKPAPQAKAAPPSSLASLFRRAGSSKAMPLPDPAR